MKNTKLFMSAIAIASLFISSCTKDYMNISGIGPITTKTIQVDNFSAIDMEGVSDVYITYGTEQKVSVTGHANIISRIQTDVSNGTWYIELERGNYGQYELSYHLTLPLIEEIRSSGTGNVIINEFPAQEDLSVKLIGTGSFKGFPMLVNDCDIDISGSGNAEVSVESNLEVNIDGSGSVYYKGDPIIRDHIQGSGTVSKL